MHDRQRGVPDDDRRSIEHEPVGDEEACCNAVDYTDAADVLEAIRADSAKRRYPAYCLSKYHSVHCMIFLIPKFSS